MQTSSELDQVQKLVQAERSLVWKCATNDQRLDALSLLEKLTKIVGRSNAPGVYARDIKKLAHRSKQYESFTRKLRYWRDSVNTDKSPIEHSQYPGGGNKRKNHNVDGNTILSRKEQECIFEHIIDKNINDKVDVDSNEVREMIWNVSQFNMLRRNMKNSQTLFKLFCKKHQLTIQKNNLRCTLSHIGKFKQIREAQQWQLTMEMQILNVKLPNVKAFDQS